MRDQLISSSGRVISYSSEYLVQNQQLVFDIYDSAVDGADNVNLGFGPIIDVLTGPQKSTTAFTSIFSFIWYLKSQNPSSASAIDNLVSDKNIDPVNDIYGSGETHDGGDSETLPIFKLLTLGSSPYSFSMGGGSFRMNEMRNNRFFRFTASSTSTRLDLTCNDYCILGVWQAGAYLTEGYSSSNQTSIINVPTVAGREYAVLVTTEGYFTSTNGTMTFNGFGSPFSNQGGFTFYGFNYSFSANERVRWGFAWNNETNQASNDVSGGIGMGSSYGNFSAGDKINCCQINTGINRSARVEVYIR
jgi:hypothetical protein